MQGKASSRRDISKLNLVAFASFMVEEQSQSRADNRHRTPVVRSPALLLYLAPLVRAMRCKESRGQTGNQVSSSPRRPKTIKPPALGEGWGGERENGELKDIRINIRGYAGAVRSSQCSSHGPIAMRHSVLDGGTRSSTKNCKQNGEAFTPRGTSHRGCSVN